MAKKVSYPWTTVKEVTADKDGLVLSLTEEEAAMTETAVNEKDNYPAPEVEESKYPYPEPEVKTDCVECKKTEKTYTFTDSVDTLIKDETLIFTDKNGLSIPDVIIAKEMVQDYEGEKVLKSGAELEAIVPLLDNMPITLDHPPGKLVRSRKQIGGYVRNPRFIKDNKSVVCDFEIFNDKLIDAIKAGKRSVSLGFQAEVQENKGKLADTDYSKVQIDIVPDHVAVVECGRCSLFDGCGIPMKGWVEKEVTPLNDEADKNKAILDEAKKIVDEKRQEIVAKLSTLTGEKDMSKFDGKSIKELNDQIDIVMKARKEGASTGALPVADGVKKSSKLLIEEAYKKAFDY